MCPADPFGHLCRAFRIRIPLFASMCVIVFLCAGLTSCVGHYCIEGIFNPGGTITGGTGACVVNKAMGNVSIRLTSSAVPTDGPMAPNFSHLFVTLQGIEAHPDSSAEESSPDWEELAPEFVLEPMQFDLLAHSANSCATNRVPAARVSAGAYRAIRLRLATSHPAPGDAAPVVNACGARGLHCGVSPDGHLHPLALGGGSPILRLTPDRISGGFFYVLPEAETHLTIEFNRFASFAAPSGEAVQLTPVFTVDAAPSCGDALSSDQ